MDINFKIINFNKTDKSKKKTLNHAEFIIKVINQE